MPRNRTECSDVRRRLHIVLPHPDAWFLCSPVCPHYWPHARLKCSLFGTGLSQEFDGHYRSDLCRGDSETWLLAAESLDEQRALLADPRKY